MKISKKLLSILLCAVMVLGSVAIGGNGFAEVFETFSFKVSAYSTGDYIYYGTYPQSKVTDSALVSALNGAGGSWKSYGYYSGTGSLSDGQMKPSDYMRYKDVSYNGSKYRAVTFDSYRPLCTGYTSSASNTCQNDNGYTTGNVYWFKYEPIKWRVLDPSTGLIMCDTAIDSQAFNNYIWCGIGSLSSSSEFYGDEAHTYYASNYAKSSIRAWLNKDFYNTAFSSDQKSNIVSTTLDNSSTYSSAYDAPATTDKIFLLSYSDSINSSYGFSSSYSDYDTARQLKSTDYAKCQGCYQNTSNSYPGNCRWWLRSPFYDNVASEIDFDGDSGHDSYVYQTYRGVVPALRLSNLKSDYTGSEMGRSINSYKAGDTIEFGWYPQSEVTNETLVSSLNELAGNNTDWESYNYNCKLYTDDGNMNFSDYMRYTDIVYENEKYRGVVFDSYRPSMNPDVYIKSSVYWFKYEPLEWQVIDPNSGMIITKNVIDAQPFHNNVVIEGTNDWGDITKTYLASDYSESSIRQWLNNEFYNTAFSLLQQNTINFTTPDNSRSFYSSFIEDKIYLLSYNVAVMGNWDDEDRKAKGSDYSICQGAFTYDNGASWTLCDPYLNHGQVHTIKCNGDWYYAYGHAYYITGIRAVVNLNTKADIIQSSINEIGLERENGCRIGLFATSIDKSAETYDSVTLKIKFSEKINGNTVCDEDKELKDILKEKVIIRDYYTDEQIDYFESSNITTTVSTVDDSLNITIGNALPGGAYYVQLKPDLIKSSGTDEIYSSQETIGTELFFSRNKYKVERQSNESADKNYSAKYSWTPTNIVLPGLSSSSISPEKMVPQAMAYYPEKNWILVGAYSKNGDETAIFALDFNTGNLEQTFYIYNADGTPNKGHMGGIAVSANNLYISDGIPGKTSTIGYIPLSDLTNNCGTAKKLKIRDNVSTGSFMNNTYPAYMSCSNGELWFGNFYNAVFITEPSYMTSASASYLYDTALFGFKLNDSSNEWSAVKSELSKGNYSHRITLPINVDSIQGCYVTDKYCILSKGTTVAGSTLYVFDVDLNRSKEITFTKPHYSYDNLSGAENIFVKDGYVYCAYESCAYDTFPLNANVWEDKTDKVWRMKLEETQLFTDRVNYGDCYYVDFDKSIEECVLSTNSTTYNPELANMLMAFSYSAYSKADIYSSLLNFGFKSASIEISDNYDSQVTPKTEYTIASKKLSNGSTLVFIPIRGSHSAGEWLLDFDTSTDDNNLHNGFEAEMDMIYADIRSYFGGSVPKSNVVYVMTGHSRGAAVSNLLAWKLKESGVPASSIYSYNFACPDTVYMDNNKLAYPQNYSFIFNISNANDIVSYVPGVLCSSENKTWTKFGSSYWFKFNGEKTDLDINFASHNKAKYYEYLSKEKSLSQYYTYTEIKAWMQENSDVWQSIKKYILVGVACPVNVELQYENGNVITALLNGEVKEYNNDELHIYAYSDGEVKYFLIPNNGRYKVQILGTDSGTMDVDIQYFEAFSDSVGKVITYTNVAVEERKNFTCTVGNFGVTDKLYVTDEQGGIISAISENGEETSFDKVSIKVAGAKTIDYRSIVTITATATDVPEDCKLVLYVNGSKVATGDNKSVSYSVGELKSDVNYTVKIVDAKGNVQKDSNGNELKKDGGKITCNAGFFKKLVAFFKGLFSSLPKVEVKP